MSRESIVRAVAGAVVLTGLGLGVSVDPRWFFLAAFAGTNLLQSSFTGFCPLESILERFAIGRR